MMNRTEKKPTKGGTIFVSEQGNRAKKPVQVSTNYGSIDAFAAAVIQKAKLTKQIGGFFTKGGRGVTNVADLKGQVAVTYVLGSAPGKRTRMRSRSPIRHEEEGRSMHERKHSRDKIGLFTRHHSHNHAAPEKKPRSKKLTADQLKPRSKSPPPPTKSSEIFAHLGQVSHRESHRESNPSPSSQRSNFNDSSSYSPVPGPSLSGLGSSRRLSGSHRAPGSRRSVSPSSIRSGPTRRRSRSRSRSRGPHLMALYPEYHPQAELDAGLKKRTLVEGVLNVPTWSASAVTVDLKNGQIKNDNGRPCVLMINDPTSIQQFCPRRNRALPGDSVVVQYDKRCISDSMSASLVGEKGIPVVLGTVVGIAKRSFVNIIFGVLADDARTDVDAIDGFGVVAPLNSAYPKFLVPIHQMENYDARKKLTVALQVKDWPVTHRLPMADLLGPLGESTTTPFLVEERLVLTELNRIRINHQGVMPEALEDEIQAEFLNELSASTMRLLDDVNQGLLKDLREDVRAFLLLRENETEAPIAFSCMETEDGYRVGVHVVDAGSLVREGSKLDEKLKRNMRTVPLPHMVHQMMPGIAQARLSLQPGLTRRCFSVMWTVSGKEVGDIWCGQSAVAVRCALTPGDIDGVVRGCPHLPVPISGHTEYDNPVTMLEDIRKLIELVDSLPHQRRLRQAPHPYLRRLYRAAIGSSSGLDALEDLSFMSSLPVPKLDLMRNALELEANTHILEFMRPLAPSGILPKCAMAHQQSIFATSKDLPLGLEVFLPPGTSPTNLPTAHWSSSHLAIYLRDWTIASSASTSFTSPFDRYVDVVIQRLVVRLITSARDEEEADTEGGIKVTVPTAEKGMGKWKPTVLTSLLAEDARHTILAHHGYERILDVMKRMCLDQARGKYLRVHALFAGMTPQGLVGVWVPDWGLLKWTKLVAQDGWTADIPASFFEGQGAPSISFFNPSNHKRTLITPGDPLYATFHPKPTLTLTVEMDLHLSPGSPSPEKASAVAISPLASRMPFTSDMPFGAITPPGVR